jgi:hypothetical protein
VTIDREEVHRRRMDLNGAAEAFPAEVTGNYR